MALQFEVARTLSTNHDTSCCAVVSCARDVSVRNRFPLVSAAPRLLSALVREAGANSWTSAGKIADAAKTNPPEHHLKTENTATELRLMCPLQLPDPVVRE